jgi:hypothetical protein
MLEALVHHVQTLPGLVMFKLVQPTNPYFLDVQAIAVARPLKCRLNGMIVVLMRTGVRHVDQQAAARG